MDRRGRRLPKVKQIERERRIIYLRDEDHKKNGGEQLLWKEISQRLGLVADKVASIYRNAKIRLEGANAER